MMSKAECARIRDWHENAYAELCNRNTSTMSYLGRTLTILPDVFAPTPMSDLLGNAVLKEVKASDRVLDMGTGCGVNAILAAGKAQNVVGVDINPQAITCAKQNAVQNHVADRIDFHQSDIFENVEGNFDLIVYDPPFRWFAPRDQLEAAITDKNYEGLIRFMKEAPKRLRPKGRILLFFGSSGDQAFLEHLIKQSGLSKTIVGERVLEKDKVCVRYCVYRLEMQ